MLIKIKTADNGWILSYMADETEINTVYEIKDGERLSECEGFIKLFYDLKDLIGPTQDKWSKHNLTVSIEEGKNYVEETSEETD